MVEKEQLQEILNAEGELDAKIDTIINTYQEDFDAQLNALKANKEAIKQEKTDEIAKRHTVEKERDALKEANNDIDKVLADIPADCDAVVLTPMYNLSSEKKQYLIDKLNERRLPTYSTMGREDVDAGVLMGIGAFDLDRKIAEHTAFSIKGVIYGKKVPQSEQLQFYEDEIVYINKDTADLIGYQPHLRVLNNAEVITKHHVFANRLNEEASKWKTSYKPNYATNNC